jgi:hydrogenase nickel incorporation protein HypB
VDRVKRLLVGMRLSSADNLPGKCNIVHREIMLHIPTSILTLDDAIDFGTGPAGAHAPGMSQARMVKIERDILSKNDSYALENRTYLSEHGIFALNLVSSPGSGKTTLLVKSINALNGSLPLTVIEGDQQTDNDAARIRATGAPALQINTGKGCHLDAYMVGQAMQQLKLQDNSLLLIENVGNLVCPCQFRSGRSTQGRHPFRDRRRRQTAQISRYVPRL